MAEQELQLWPKFIFVTILVPWFENTKDLISIISQAFLMLSTVTVVLIYRSLKFDTRLTALASRLFY